MSKNLQAGLQSLNRKYDKLIEKYKSKAIEALEDSVLAIHADAVKSINEHSPGKIYTHRMATINGRVVPVEERNKPHIASKPGDAPNTDTGTLIKSIGFEVDKSNLEGVVGTNLKYGKHLEFGTVNMEARPWLQPATRKNRDKVKKIFRVAITAAANEGAK